MTQETPILQVRDLKTHFFTKEGVGKAVDGVSFDLKRGETLGLVGESACGKSMTCLSVLQLNPKPASRIVGGQVLFHGEDLLGKHNSEMRLIRGKYISMVLQDASAALNPVQSIGYQLYEPLRLHQKLRGRALKERAVELMRLLHIPAPRARLSSYPHELSGGMRQRSLGAMALSGNPEVLIADEPTTALDVTLQVAYLELLKEIQRSSRLSILFVTHDFSVVARMCDRVAVMYAGKIVETADTKTLFENPAHPYTEALLNSVPDVRERVTRLYSIGGQPPSLYNLNQGCPFAPRCQYVQDRCWDNFPPEVSPASGHSVSCWKYLP